MNYRVIKLCESLQRGAKLFVPCVTNNEKSGSTVRRVNPSLCAPKWVQPCLEMTLLCLLVMAIGLKKRNDSRELLTLFLLFSLCWYSGLAFTEMQEPTLVTRCIHCLDYLLSALLSVVLFCSLFMFWGQVAYCCRIEVWYKSSNRVKVSHIFCLITSTVGSQ